MLVQSTSMGKYMFELCVYGCSAFTGCHIANFLCVSDLIMAQTQLRESHLVTLGWAGASAPWHESWQAGCLPRFGSTTKVSRTLTQSVCVCVLVLMCLCMYSKDSFPSTVF